MPLVMGVVNVTPDSFSDGGRYFDTEAAVAHGRELVAEGADVIDVGGESTRPGAEPVDPVEEQRRVLPVIEALAADGIRVSVDTRNAATAERACALGATLINDVSSSLWPVAADMGAGWVAMHMLGDPRTMQVEPRYDDVVDDVRDFLVARATEATKAGVDEVWIDPGFGFGKNLDHNLALLADLDVFVATGFPVLVGLSRKSFLGRLLAMSDSAAAAPALPGFGPAVASEVTPAAPDDRIEGSLATAVYALDQGAQMVRVHEVAATVQAVKVVAG
jgi:dihydropteroate synthase